jgi:hypothetical protein
LVLACKIEEYVPVAEPRPWRQLCDYKNLSWTHNFDFVVVVKVNEVERVSNVDNHLVVVENLAVQTYQEFADKILIC